MSKSLRVLLLSGALLLTILLAPHASAAPPDLRERLRQLGGTPCPNSIFTCVTLTVPLDHFNPADGRATQVVFAVLPATGARKGMFVTATGGPGTAGIAFADSYLSYMAREIPQKFDIVFFDQRGIGLSGGMDCFRAAASFYQSPWRADTPARAVKLKKVAQTFASDCDARMGYPALLPLVGTRQAVEDLELFRQQIGDEKFWLYGESYGTQYAQTYAHAHPDRLAGMILDGTVDLTPDGISYYADAAQSFTDTLVASLNRCERIPSCAADFGTKPLRAFDKLSESLQAHTQSFVFPLGNGAHPTRRFGFDDLDTTAEGQMYDEDGRLFFVRALAKYSRDRDLSPLARLLYPNLGIDEANLKPYFDPSWSDAVYYGVECQDYGYFEGSAASRADRYLAQALPVEASGLRLSGLIWGDLPCVYWRDSSQDTTRPPYWSAPGIPTIVLNALADPITPIAGARAVYEHLDDGYLITQRGGPHVIWERGVACIDDPVNAFLIEGVLPAQRETECPGRIMSDYVPLAPADAQSFASPLEAMRSAETEINYLPEFWNWDYATPTAVGCGENGTLQFARENDEIKFTLDSCAFTKGFEMTGAGDYRRAKDRFRLTVQVAGYQTCRLKYQRVGSQETLKGDCAGSRMKVQAQTQGEISPKRTLRRAVPRIWRPR